ncbi:iron (metal) dependent repressor, DtxR family protein [Candidatus Woesearchaeota archaeon CG_4_10_14_0_2_um_filter_57_5]|nr:MAG: hypothetical protein AUJ68_01365 [Candidatus Woesearchaeota archaeon CG1_02_57_44]PIN68574.1 MAG: iron (metal) dependent repressor, DtxR family protein [Candidatus Woesearchaeota archaeon CG11_big_fil_rev_8_21_14_0_20_57_5]PIZ52741.1 MAG: iron (metal) dependent repressor, DtxR family protein [Candidatus Woesearchaeota archaeon CG_4_10_14_0_2_um_filter_57_5]
MQPAKLHAGQKNKITTEMYLKAIYLISDGKSGPAKSVEIAEELNLSKGSVSEMLKKLADDGLIAHQPYADVELTVKGKNAAKKVVRRYSVIRDFLESIGVPHAVAHHDACNFEHAASDETITKLETLLKK